MDFLGASSQSEPPDACTNPIHESGLTLVSGIGGSRVPVASAERMTLSRVERWKSGQIGLPD